MHCHSITSCITTSFIRAYLPHKRGSIKHKRQWARKSKRNFTLLFLFSVASATQHWPHLSFTLSFFTLYFSQQTPFVRGTWGAMPWHVVKSISMKKSQGSNFTCIALLSFPQLDIYSVFACQRKQVCACVSAPMCVCVCVHLINDAQAKNTYTLSAA